MRHTRNNFTKDTKRQAFDRSKVNGVAICECHLIPHVFPVPCGLPLGIGNTFYEHIDPSRISGRNDLANAAALTKTCWRYKTDTFDTPVITKTRHLEDFTAGIKPDRKITGWRNFKGEPVYADRER